MSVHPTTHRKTLRGLVAAGTILLTSFGATGVASATSPSVTKVDGNPNCASIGAGYTELKIDPVPQGSSSKRSGSFTGAIRVSDRVFNWTSNQGVDVVIVKGGPNANIYRYSPEAKSGTGLHAPVNPSNGQFYGLSHIDFCYDAGENPVTPEPPKTCPSGQQMDDDGKCFTPEPPKTCPSGQQMDDDGECFTPEPPKTCPAGQEMSSEGECVAPPKTCPEGQSMNSAGECVPPKQETSSTPPVTETVTETQPVVAGEQSRTEPQPAVVQVLGATGRVERVAARARMQGPKRCITRPYSQVLRGTGIKRVTMYVNGRKVQTMAGGRSKYVLRVNPDSARGGIIRIAAKVEYVAGSGKRTQTLRATALRCAQQAVLPRFAG